jgi:3-phenylpropionate/trans-cinnamate dioxygenase ferredoxin reductase subunit
MTNEVARIARIAGAVCYTDPFTPNTKADEATGLVARLFGAADGSRKGSKLFEAA